MSPRSTFHPHLDTASAVPLYEQMIEQVALAVAAGHLQPGDALPSVRELAATLRINPNTAARALRELDRLGLAQAVRGVGSVVAEGAATVAPEIAGRILERELAGAVKVARQLRMSQQQLLAAVERQWKEDTDAD